jgi:predicted HTH domain antitoxin
MRGPVQDLRSAISAKKEQIRMEKTISVEIPEQWLKGLDWDQRTVVQEIVRLGTYQLKVRRALDMYQAGAGSLGYIAEKAGLSKRDLIREARSRGIAPPFDEQTVREELGA